MRIVLLIMSLVICFGSAASAASLEAMVGQMILVGFRGDSANDAGVRAVREDIAAGRIGGVIYLKHNIASMGRVETINAGFVAAATGPKPLIALDQEGGSIERLTRDVGFSEIPSAARIAANRSVAEAGEIYGQMAVSIAALGFNTNFGPVVDLNLNNDNPIIARYGRSFSADANKVAAYAGSFIDGHRRAGVLTALKHFPGHGSSRADSHEGFVDISNYWQPEELDPYRLLLANNRIDMVMMAHLYHRQFSDAAGQIPASLSANWITGVLRTQIGFEGVVISDDMEMGAVRSLFSLPDAVIMAVEAGTDILLFSNTANYRTSLAREIGDILIAKAQADPAFLARIEQSYQRIIDLKQRL